MKLLTQTAIDIIASKDVSVYEDVIIAGVSLKSHLKDSSYNFGRDFAAANATITLQNPNGMYSPGGTNEIKEGVEAIIVEGMYLTDGSLESYSGFTGLVKRPRVNKQRTNEIVLECVDYINKLGGCDIDYTKSGTKVPITTERLMPNFINIVEGQGFYSGYGVYDVDIYKNWAVNKYNGMRLFSYDGNSYPITTNNGITMGAVTGIANGPNSVFGENMGSGDSGLHDYAIGEGVAQVFDSQHQSWCQNPLPGITVKKNKPLTNGGADIFLNNEIPTAWNGFSVKYENGQVVLGLPIDAINYRVQADYSYYSAGVYVEDIIEEIITEPDDYGNVMFTVADNLTTKFSNESSDAYDAMSPNYAPDTDPDVATALAAAVDLNSTEISLLDYTGFRVPGAGEVAYIQIGDEVIQYGGTLGWWRDAQTGTPPTGRGGHRMVYCSSNGLYYVFGGYDGTNYLNDLYSFNPATNVWSAITPATATIPGTRAWHAMVYNSETNEILVAGGYNNVVNGYLDVYKYSITGNEWTTNAAWNMPNKLWDMMSLFIPTVGATAGGMMICGGTFASMYAATYLFNGSTWAYKGEMPYATAYGAACWMADKNLALVVAEINNTDVMVSATYNLTTNTWTEVAAPPVVRHEQTLVYDSTNNQALMFGGSAVSTAGIGTKNLYSYDPTADAWTELTAYSEENVTQHAAVWDSAYQQMVVWGGCTTPWTFRSYIEPTRYGHGATGSIGHPLSSLVRGQMGTVASTHARGDNVYQIYPAGQLWFTRFNNIQTALVEGDFSLDIGVFRSFNNRYGRLTMDAPITTTADVRCNVDYSFKTLQATGVMVNEVEFRERDFKDRIATLNRVREYVAPNYVLRTEGDRRIWGSYLNQNYIEDYTAAMEKSISYEPEEETYTHVKLYGENNNPTNLMTEYPVVVMASEFWAGDSGAWVWDGSNYVNDTFIAAGIHTFPGTTLSSPPFTYDQLAGYQLIDHLGNYFNIYGNHGDGGQTLIVSGMPSRGVDTITTQHVDVQPVDADQASVIEGNWKIGRFNVGEVFGQECTFRGVRGNYFEYDPGVGAAGSIIAGYSASPPSPRIKLNGVYLDSPQPVAVGPVAVKLITDYQIQETKTVDGQETGGQTYNKDYNYAIQFPHRDIIPDIYTLSNKLIDQTNDIFIYLVGAGGGGIKASIQLFSNREDITKYAAGQFADASQLEPLFTIPVNDPYVNYRNGIWGIHGIPSYAKTIKALAADVSSTDTTIQFLKQKYYVKMYGTVLPTLFAGTCVFSEGYGGTPYYGGAYCIVSDPSANFGAVGSLQNYIFIDSAGGQYAISTNTNTTITFTGNYGFPALGTYYIYARAAKTTFDNVEAYAHQVDANTWLAASEALYTGYINFETNPEDARALAANNLTYMIGRIFAKAVPSGYFGIDSLGVDTHIYMPATGAAIFENLKYGDKNFEEPTTYGSTEAAEDPILILGGQEIISYNTVTKISSTEKIMDLFDTFNGADWGGDISNVQRGILNQIGGIYRGQVELRVVNEIWQLGDETHPVKRGQLGTTAGTFTAPEDVNTLFCAVEGNTLTNLAQKKFFYRNFVAGLANTDVENIGSAIYYVWHDEASRPGADFYINYDNNTFMIKSDLFADKVYGVPQDVVRADFKFTKRMVPMNNWINIFDGRYNTSAQCLYSIEPLPDTELFTVDLGAVREISAIDIMGGYYSLQGNNTELGQIAFTNQYTLKYSLDNITYLLPTDKASSFSLASGNTFTLDRDALGAGFQARYLKLLIEKAQKHNYDKGQWYVSIADFRAYADTILIGDAKLIARSEHGTAGVGTTNTMTDASKAWTTDQWVGQYLVDSYDYEFYITANGATTLTVDGTPATGEYFIFPSRQGDLTVYDKAHILPLLGDRLYKNSSINSEITTRRSIDRLAKQTLVEYIKNHQRVSLNVSVHPGIRLGQTIKLVDNLNHVDKRYFVESVAKSGRGKTLTLANYS